MNGLTRHMRRCDECGDTVDVWFVLPNSDPKCVTCAIEILEMDYSKLADGDNKIVIELAMSQSE